MKVLKLILSLIFLLSCAESLTQKVKKQDDFVLKGYFPFYAPFIPHDSHFKETIEMLREKIERDSLLFTLIIKKYFEVMPHLRFQYRGAKITENQEKLILIYFSPFPHPKIFAGYRIEFVISIKTKKIEKIYVDMVPLE